MDIAAQHKEPVELTREELHAQVWNTSMSRLAALYGVSGNGLKKICNRLDIPYPSLGHWAKKAAGHDVPTKPLPQAGAGIPRKITITPTPPSPAPPTVAPEIKQKIEATGAEIEPISETLEKSHPLVAAWMKDMERRRKETRRGGLNAFYSAGDLTEMHQRQLRILNALFKTLARHGVTVAAAGHNQFVLELSNEKLEIQLRERQRRGIGRRTADERHRAFPGDPMPRDDMEGTGRLVFTIKNYLPGNLPREWLDSEARPMEVIIREVAGTILAAFPLLATQTQQRHEAEQQRQIAEQQRYQEQQRRKLEDNRWRKFVEIARQWEDVELARRYLAALKADPALRPDEVAGGRALTDWLEWTTNEVDARDPLKSGSGATYSSVGAITTWSYHD